MCFKTSHASSVMWMEFIQVACDQPDTPVGQLAMSEQAMVTVCGRNQRKATQTRWEMNLKGKFLS